MTDRQMILISPHIDIHFTRIYAKHKTQGDLRLYADEKLI